MTKVIDFIEKEIEKGNVVGRIADKIFPLLFVTLKSKNPSDLKKNIALYLLTRRILDTGAGITAIASLGTLSEIGITKKLYNWQSTENLAQEFYIDRERLETLLDFLVKDGILETETRNGIRFYRIGDDFKRFLKNGEGTIALLWSQLKALSELPRILKTKKPSQTLDIYNLEGDYKSLLLGVNEFLYRATQELMRKYEFKNLKRVMIGSMGVSFAKNIQKRFPDVEIHIGCYPHLIREVPKLIEKYKLTNVKSIKEHKGSPSEDKWGDEEKKYDLVFLTKKLTLRNLSEFGNEFLRKSHSVLAKGGYAVIWEAIVDDSGTKGPLLESVLDILVSYSGKRWKESDLRKHILSFGFEKFEVVRCLGGRTTFGIAVK